jgi:hypothetical protein
VKSGELQRKTPLRRKPLRRVVIVHDGRVRVRRHVDERRIAWNRAIRGTVCVVCRERPAVEGHHIVKEQVLRRYAAGCGYDFEEARFDWRNRLGVCRDCHANHHSRSRPISREVLWRFAPWVFDFARELGLEWALDREYPEATSDRMEAVA